MISTGRQIAAARALLGWSQGALAKAAGLHHNSIAYWEARADIPCSSPYRTPVACRRMSAAFLEAGVETFQTPSAGVRLVRVTQLSPQYARTREAYLKQESPR